MYTDQNCQNKALVKTPELESVIEQLESQNIEYSNLNSDISIRLCRLMALQLPPLQPQFNSNLIGEIKESPTLVERLRSLNRNLEKRCEELRSIKNHLFDIV